MKKIIFLTIICLLFLTGCINKIDDKEISNTQDKDDNNMNLNIKLIINSNTYNITLDNNETSKEFIKLLPLEINMTELNNNEKYYYLDSTLTTNPYNPNQIVKGDLMLYGNNCLVLFYKDFNTNYSYTKLGHIDNLPNLDDNDIKVIFKQS